ncbi:SDR family oxidoreductase [candidate division WWE3 bacterium]|nr:SDR family oxidoreductase [candidate division WWE3 bacterium]
MKGKYALVTGASTGIGRAIAIELAGEGAFVCLSARNKTKLEETKNLIQEIGGRCDVIPADLADLRGSLFGLAEYVHGMALDGLDILVNTAAIWHGINEVYADKNFEDFDESLIIDTLNVGILAPMLLTLSFASKMPKESSVINISGTFENGAKGWLPYYVSKRAIEDLTVGLAEEFKYKGIKVNCISPSDTATEEYKKFFPDDAKGAQSPEEVAKATIELIKKDVTGKVFVVKNGKIEEGYHK